MLEEVFKNAEAPSDGTKLFVVVSSDRGLCGGIHSSVTKQTRRLLAEGSNADAPIVVLGDKSKAQLVRLAPNNLALTFNQVGKDVPTFADAATIADLITTSGIKFDSVQNFFASFMMHSPSSEFFSGQHCVQQVRLGYRVRGRSDGGCKRGGAP